MQVTATNYPVAIDYRIKGKTYGNQEGQFPFDTQTLMPGQSWSQHPGVDFIRARILSGAPGQGVTPQEPSNPTNVANLGEKGNLPSNHHQIDQYGSAGGGN